MGLVKLTGGQFESLNCKIAVRQARRRRNFVVAECYILTLQCFMPLYFFGIGVREFIRSEKEERKKRIQKTGDRNKNGKSNKKSNIDVLNKNTSQALPRQ